MKNHLKSMLRGKTSMLMLSCLFAGTILSSCSKDDDVKNSEEKTTFKWKSTLVGEYIGINYDASNTLESYFGKRLTLSTPQTLLFNKDSLTISKPGDIKETYKIQWNGNKFSLYNPTTEKWMECGEKTAEGIVKMSMELYCQENNDNNQQLISFGQGYDLPRPAQLMETKTGKSKIYWVKLNYTFE